jgi:predicted acyltransferase
MSATVQLSQEQNRILSIDFFRGFTMFMLVCGIEGLFEKVDPAQRGAIISFIEQQTSHASWGSGIHFWDLIQPFFMFIVGVAMPFSFSRRWDRGDSWEKTFYHVLWRCLILLYIGWAKRVRVPGEFATLCDVLAQLSVTYLIAFLLMRKPIKWQLFASFALLLVSNLIYRFFPVEGFNQPFVAQHNFGTWTDILLHGKGSGDYAPFNAIPSSAHTIWGVVVGMVLMKEWPHRKKFLTLLIVGLIGVIVGYAMNPFIPIIKQICTASFMIVTGGYCFIAMAISFWVVDVLKFRKVPMFFIVWGMNSIFLYLMAGSFRTFFGRMVNPFIYPVFSWSNQLTITIISFIIIAAMLWYVCYFMYKRKIFIRI